MRETLGQQKFNRRRVLISLISSAPLAALLASGTEALAKVAQRGAQYQPCAERGPSVRRVQFFHRAEPVQAGRGRDLPVRLVPLVDQERGLTKERLHLSDIERRRRMVRHVTGRRHGDREADEDRQ